MQNILSALKSEKIYEHILFYSTIFLTGALVLVIEIVGARIMSVQFGSTVYVWSSLITVTMAGLAAGYWIGGIVARERRSINVYMATFFAAGLMQLGILLFSQQVLAWSNMFGLVWGPLVAATILFAPPVIAFGFISPYAVKMRVDELKNVGVEAGNLYALSTIGSLGGGLVAGFILAPILTVSQILYYNATITLLIAFLWIVHDYVVYNKGVWWRAGLLFVVAILLLSEAHVSFVRVNDYAQVGYDETLDMPRYPTLFTTSGNVEANVVFQEPSQYGDIVVFDYGPQQNVRCFLIDGVNETCWNYLNKVPSLYVKNTGDIITTLQQTRGVEDVLVIGAGGGTLLKYLDGSGVTVDAVEINEKMQRVAEDFFVLPKELNFEFFIDDGRHFLNNTDKTYDVIVMDICFVSEANVHLWTTEFYELAKQHLSKDGVIIATRGMVSGNEKMERLDHMTFNALADNFAHTYTGRRFEDTPGTFYMGLFVASDTPLKSLDILGEGWPITPWQTDQSYPIARDERQPEMLELVYPATEAILEQSREHFGEELLLPL